jgi:hypothetical protein
MAPCVAVAQNHLDHTEAIDNRHRYLISAFPTVVERRLCKVQSKLRREGFVGHKRFLLFRLSDASKRTERQNTA